MGTTQATAGPTGSGRARTVRRPPVVVGRQSCCHRQIRTRQAGTSPVLLLQRVTVFSDVPLPVLERIEVACTHHTAHDNERIFMEGDAGDAVYAITGGEGRVKIHSVSRNSKALLAQVFGVGEIFGEIAVIDGKTRTAQATAEGRVQLVRIPGSVFLNALTTQPEVGAGLCRALSERLRRTYALLEDTTFESVEVRFARQVLYLARVGSRQTEQGLRLIGRFRQSDLADLLGTTTRSIITILNAWRAAGVVIYDAEKGLLTIVRQKVLEALVSGEIPPGNIPPPAA